MDWLLQVETIVSSSAGEQSIYIYTFKASVLLSGKSMEILSLFIFFFAYKWFLVIYEQLKYYDLYLCGIYGMVEREMV